MRISKKYFLPDSISFSQNLLKWLEEKSIFSYLNSNGMDKTYGSYELLCAYEIAKEFVAPENDVINAFKKFFKEVNDWLFGFFCYDLKNELENLTSLGKDRIKMPLIHFFQPKILFLIKDDTLEIAFLKEYYTEKDADALFNELLNIKNEDTTLFPFSEKATHKVHKKEYINKIQNIQKHIQLGDIYEMNYCTEFFSILKKPINPNILYTYLNNISPAPCSCLYKLHDKSLICSSPERFLKKIGNKVISQPIKGTIRRGKDETEDILLAKQLSENEKERSENVMIVDLVRNDLSHFAQKGSVKVDELFGIYSYAQVHQMISTISCELKENTCPVDVVMKCFPPGSMTGAPKIKAMQIIEENEKTKRGLYAGACGYFTPERDFDFNVIIRSILVNNTEKYVSFMAGGAITALSDSILEYEECLLKASAMAKSITKP